MGKNFRFPKFVCFKNLQCICISFDSCIFFLGWWENSSFLIFVRLKPANPPILFLSARTNRNIHASQFAKEISKIRGATLCKHFHRGWSFYWTQAMPCHSVTESLLVLNFAQIIGFVKVVTLISLSCLWICQRK